MRRILELSVVSLSLSVCQVFLKYLQGYKTRLWLEIQLRQGRDQALRVRMSGLQEDLRGRTCLDDLTLVQDSHPIANLGHRRQIV